MFRLLILVISISIGLGSSHLPFETFSYKLLKNAESHDTPDLSIKSINNAFIEALQTPKTLNLRSKPGRKAGKKPIYADCLKRMNKSKLIYTFSRCQQKN